jgi:hypothetical protein
LGQRPQLTVEFSPVEFAWLEILVGFHPVDSFAQFVDPRSEEMASCSKLNPFNFADCDLVLGSVVELSGRGRLMRAQREFAGEFVRRTWVQAQGLLP